MLEGHVPVRACWFNSSRAHLNDREAILDRSVIKLVIDEIEARRQFMTVSLFFCNRIAT